VTVDMLLSSALCGAEVLKGGESANAFLGADYEAAKGA